MKEYAFRIDCHGETRQVTKHWQFCIGSGHAALAQRADYLEQLKTVHDELGIQRVRFHGIFNDDMNVCILCVIICPPHRQAGLNYMIFTRLAGFMTICWTSACAPLWS